MRLINLLIIFIVALIFEARGEPTTENNVTVENETVTSTESCNKSTIEEPESLVKENPEPSDSKTTLPESEPKEGSEDLVDKEKSQNINASTEVPGTERTLTESEPQEGFDNLVNEKESLNKNSATETPSTEITLTDSEVQNGTEDLDDKDQSLNNNSFIEVPETEGSLVVSYYNKARGRNAIGPFSKIQLHKLPIPTKSPRRAHHLRRTMIKIFEGLEKGLKKILDPESSEESVETLPESEPQEGSEVLVDKENQNINTSTEVLGTERTLTESDPQEGKEGSEKLDEKEQSLDNSSTKVAETENTTNSEPQEGSDNLDDEEQSLNNNSSTETPSTESTLTDSEAEKGTEDLDDKDQSLNNNSFIEIPETEGTLVVSYYNEARNAIGPFSKIQLHKVPIPTKSPRRAHHLRRTMIKILGGLEKGLKKILDPESGEESVETLPESEPQKGSEDLVDSENQNINSSTEVPGTERTLTESEPQEASEKLDEKEQSLDNSSTKVAETENTTNSGPQKGPDNLDDEEQSLNNNSSTETPSTESTLTDSGAQKGTEDLDDKDQSLNNNSFIEVPETEGSLVVSYRGTYEARGRNAIGPFSKIQLHKLPIPTKSPRRAHHLQRTMIKLLGGLKKGLKKILDPESDEESVETS